VAALSVAVVVLAPGRVTVTERPAEVAQPAEAPEPSGFCHAGGDVIVESPAGVETLHKDGADGVDGSFRIGTAAAPTFTVSSAGSGHFEGDLTIGPVGDPTVTISADGTIRTRDGVLSAPAEAEPRHAATCRRPAYRRNGGR
jgi:hypothetical protein